MGRIMRVRACVWWWWICLREGVCRVKQRRRKEADSQKWPVCILSRISHHHSTAPHEHTPETTAAPLEGGGD